MTVEGYGVGRGKGGAPNCVVRRTLEDLHAIISVAEGAHAILTRADEVALHLIVPRAAGDLDAVEAVAGDEVASGGRGAPDGAVGSPSCDSHAVQAVSEVDG